MGCKSGRSRDIIRVSPDLGFILFEGEQSRLASEQFCKAGLSPCETSALKTIAMLASQTSTVARQFLFLVYRKRNEFFDLLIFCV